MTDNAKKEEKWTFNFTDAQCWLISDALVYVITRCEERINGNNTITIFDKFTAQAVKRAAAEIVQQIADVTS